MWPAPRGPLVRSFAVAVASARFGFVRRNWIALTALAGYGALAFLYLGLRLLVESGHQYLGFGVDPELFIWDFGWWPHAILHGQNPFVTHAIWAPDGVNLTWTTSVPGLALLFSPLTLVVGPIVSYDVAGVLMPCLAAWTAFLFCRRLTRAVWPSLVGGYLFGFSSYMFGQEEGHPHMTGVFAVPLIALVLVRYLDGELEGRGLVVRLGPLLAFELLVSTEVTFTLALALFVALVVGFAAAPSRRSRLRSLLPPLGAAYAFAALLTSPFIYYAITGFQPHLIQGSEGVTADLVNFISPTRLGLPSFPWLNRLSTEFAANDSERDAYLGIPSLLILALFAARRGRTEGGRFLLACFTVSAVAQLSTQLTYAGHIGFWLPWSLVANLPIFDDVLPARFALYTSLIVAVVVASWARAARGRWLRWLLPALAAIALVPNPDSGAWATSFTVPRFFTDHAFRDCLDPGENILPLPVGSGGDSMLWQATNGYRFRMAGGYIASDPPKSFRSPDQIAAVAGGQTIPVDQATLLAYIHAKGVTSVIVDERAAASWSPTLDPIASPQQVGGVVIYRVAPGEPSCDGR